MSAQNLGTVARAVRVLRAVAEAEGEVTVAGIAAELDLPRPTVHRLLNLLREEGMVEATGATRSYAIGQEFFRISALVSKRQELTRLARPVMERVVDSCGETCLLGVYLPAQRRMIFAEEVRSTHPLGYRIDPLTPISVIWGASGRAILAYRPESELADVLAEDEEPSVTGAPAPSLEELVADLRAIREQGFAYSEGQKIPGSRGIAAPVRNAEGDAVASLCLTIPEQRFRRNAKRVLGDLLRRHADELSTVLGFEPGTVPTR